MHTLQNFNFKDGLVTEIQFREEGNLRFTLQTKHKITVNGEKKEIKVYTDCYMDNPNFFTLENLQEGSLVCCTGYDISEKIQDVMGFQHNYRLFKVGSAKIYGIIN